MPVARFSPTNVPDLAHPQREAGPLFFRVESPFLPSLPPAPVRSALLSRWRPEEA
jgi:hypothetical protein